MLITRRCFNLLKNAIPTSNVVPLSSLKFSPPSEQEGKCPLLILHGLFGSKHNWKSASLELARRTQRTVYALDLRNHGESPTIDGTTSSLDSMAADLKLFCEHKQLGRVALLGHSLGGRVCSQFAFNWPTKVQCLLLTDALPLNFIPEVSFLHQDFFHLLTTSIEQLPPQAKIGETRKAVGKKLVDFLGDEDFVRFLLMSLRKGENGLIKWRFDPTNLGRMSENNLINQLICRQPYQGKSLLIHGQNSEHAGREHYEEVKKVLPDVEFSEISGTGHYPHVEKPSEFTNCVVDFLKSSQ